MHLYFCGIGGSGLAPLAHLALDCDLQVSGSDIQEGLSLKELLARTDQISLEQDGKFLKTLHQDKPIDWFIYTSAVKPGQNPEYQFIQEWNEQNPEKQIRLSKRSQLLNYILKKKRLKLLAIAGTHGKTTTTAMLVWTFKQLNLPISYLIGTNVSFGRSAAYTSGSKYFVYECDEFDKNFLEFQPHATLLTSLDYDHPDTYATEKDYYLAFEEFLAQTDLITVGWQENLTKLKSESRFLSLSKIEKNLEIEQLKLTGRHNRENAFLAGRLLESLKIIPAVEAYPILSAFPGTQRRFEKLVEGVFTDYAHHPAEIAATLQTVEEYRQLRGLDSAKIIAIYQPHQNSRQHLIQNEYQHTFDRADLVYWLPTYLTREDPNQRTLEPEELSQHVEPKNKVQLANLDEVLLEKLKQHQNQGDLLIFMGAGNIDGWARLKFGVVRN